MTTPAKNFSSYPLVSTKLNRPRRTSDLLLRHHLIEKLNGGLDRKLTLISAPAGYGKTTLLISWLETCEAPSVWLALDEGDNSLPRFIAYFVAVVRARFPRVGASLLEMLNEQQIPPLEYVVASLVNDIAEFEEPFIFVLDDYHLIHDAGIQQFMCELIKAQPDQLHLAIASRSDPPLMLPVLRANHQLMEIRTRELRFSDQEAMLFFQGAVGRGINDLVVSALNRRTEGWSVGLRLAALSLQGGRDGAAILDGFRGGTSDFVTDYLMGEVLEQQSEPLQAFLLQTSILGRFCADLCEAVCSGPLETGDDKSSVASAGRSAAEHLAYLKRRNLFLFALDTEHGWYRYHHLFAEVLRHRLLSANSQKHVEALHRRASHWLSDHGYLEEAIQHALSANDTDFAVNLIEGQGRNLLNPIERVVLERWLSLLPREVVWRRPKMLITRAWILYRQWNMTALDAVLDRIESLLGEDVYSPDETRLIAGQVAVLRSTIAYAKHHDFHSAIDLSEKGFDQVPRSERDARSLALMMRGLSQQALGQKDRAVVLLTRNIEDTSPHAPGKTQSYIALALLHYSAGDLIQMDGAVGQMLSFAARSASVNAVTGASYVAGFLCYERNDLSAAESHFSKVLELRHRTNFIGGMAAGMGLVRIYQLRGQLDKAQNLIETLRTEDHAIENADLLPLIEAAQAEQHLARQNRSAALHWASSFQTETLNDCVFKFELAILAHARILIQCGTEAEIQTLNVQLQGQLALFEAGHFIHRIIQTLALLALVNDRLGGPDVAFALLARAVGLAQPTGFIRSVVDAGKGLAPYLQKLSAQDVDYDYIAKLLAAVDDTNAITLSAEAHSVADRTKNADMDELLTRRENEILQLIGHGMTNQEIANRLVISPHTVKTHATSIYAKLGVNGRARAVHKARQLGILLPES